MCTVGGDDVWTLASNQALPALDILPRGMLLLTTYDCCDSFQLFILQVQLHLSILLMHHWRPCLKPRSAILIVLSTVVAKDANHRFQS